jgi:hypothetical protein
VDPEGMDAGDERHRATLTASHVMPMHCFLSFFSSSLRSQAFIVGLFLFTAGASPLSQTVP